MKKQISHHTHLANNHPTLTSEDRSKFLTQLEIPVLIYILKEFASEEHPISAAQIIVYMHVLTGEEHSQKTILRKLQRLIALQNDPNEDIMTDSLIRTFGGHVVEVSNQNNPDIVKKQSRFYFEPVLDDSDISLICGAITSNRYLSPQEKEYLLSREMILSTAKRDSATLPAKPTPYKASGSQPSNLLHHVNQLYDAIENGYMIQLVYGIFDLDKEKFRRIRFHARNAQAPYLLNPYALLWNGGSYYLLATHKGHDNPVHFRVDRILSVKPLPQAENVMEKEPREQLPEALSPFFPFNADNVREFQPDKYTAVYPLMGIYNDNALIDCCIECTAATLSILIDTFGSSLNILSSTLPHTEEELRDFHGNKQQYFAVQIKSVQYDNILQFCLQQHTSITALYPPQLVQDIADTLQASLAKYQHVLQADSTNPFYKTLSPR